MIRIIRLSLILLLFSSSTGVLAQAVEDNGQSPSSNDQSNNPKSEPAVAEERALIASIPGRIVKNAETIADVDLPKRPKNATQTYVSGQGSERSIIHPTELYKVGKGDVLAINFENARQASGNYTVREDGKIDFPLAGDKVVVTGQTCDDIEEFLTARIKLFAEPRVQVTIHEYGSHKVTVKGMAETIGDINLRREAVPLYVIKAQVGVDARATHVSITRGRLLEPQIYDLKQPGTDNVLIYPGYDIDFVNPSTDSYFMADGINSPVPRVISPGLTLYQAVLASFAGKMLPRRAIIRRKNKDGILISVTHDLRSVKAGKEQNPVLAPGDVIEIGY